MKNLILICQTIEADNLIITAGAGVGAAAAATAKKCVTV